MQKFWESVKIWQSYREFKGGNSFWDTVYSKPLRNLCCCFRVRWLFLICTQLCSIVVPVTIETGYHSGSWPLLRQQSAVSKRQQWRTSTIRCHLPTADRHNCQVILQHCSPPRKWTETAQYDNILNIRPNCQYVLWTFWNCIWEKTVNSNNRATLKWATAIDENTTEIAVKCDHANEE